MDPISQACFGASLSQSFARDRTKQLSALIIGALAGMAPDLDVLIRSPDDPLLFLEFHRQFSHSLIFIPVGALLCALAFYPLAKRKLSFAQIYLFSFMGYATHGLLDACTSYGTQLYWPFSNERVAWNLISIVDPVFTIPVAVLILIAAFRKNTRYARTAFAYAVVFLALGNIQNYRAEKAVYALAQQRGHQPERVLFKPSFANRHVWKIIYEHDGHYYVDAVNLIWDTEYIHGASIQKLDLKRDFPELSPDSQQARDIERFRWFSDDFLAVNPQNSDIIMDVRYSFIPNRIKLMWGVKVDKNNIGVGELNKHVEYESGEILDESTKDEFIKMVF
jgi:inner membrane protein